MLITWTGIKKLRKQAFFRMLVPRIPQRTSNVDPLNGMEEILDRWLKVFHLFVNNKECFPLTLWKYLFKDIRKLNTAFYSVRFKCSHYKSYSHGYARAHTQVLWSGSSSVVFCTSDEAINQHSLTLTKGRAVCNLK